jgi:hypothetical protein
MTKLSCRSALSGFFQVPAAHIELPRQGRSGDLRCKRGSRKADYGSDSSSSADGYCETTLSVYPKLAGDAGPANIKHYKNLSSPCNDQPRLTSSFAAETHLFGVNRGNRTHGGNAATVGRSDRLTVHAVHQFSASECPAAVRRARRWRMQSRWAILRNSEGSSPLTGISTIAAQWPGDNACQSSPVPRGPLRLP